MPYKEQLVQSINTWAGPGQLAVSGRIALISSLLLPEGRNAVYDVVNIDHNRAGDLGRPTKNYKNIQESG